MKYTEMTIKELLAEQETLCGQFERVKAKGLSLNMARGKPGKEQLDMVSDILTVLTEPEDCFDGAMDCRNYGELPGVPSARKLFAELLGVEYDECILGGSSSLQLMYDTVCKAYTHGLLHSEQPWCREKKCRWICPVPGYDRHFKITESFGFEMIPVPMMEDGPDMAAVEELIKDPAVKGMWNVPKYSNPGGVIYSEATMRRLAAMKPAAPDFLLIWDNAYCVHEFEGEYVSMPDMLTLCREAGNEDMVFEFASTSKITFPGAGVACMASSKANISYMSGLMGIQFVCFDKVNQLRHVKYLKNKDGVLALMKKHACILQPKFAAVLSRLEAEIAPLGIASWSRPKGGYFISLDGMDGTAKRTIALAKECGVTMTGAGAAFPYGFDPHDSNIRIAPTLPGVDELEAAMDVFCLCLRLSAVEMLLKNKE